MAGLAAEGLKYDKVIGQSADLFSLQVLLVLITSPLTSSQTLSFNFLQRFINRSQPKISNEQQQNLTRWAVCSFYINRLYLSHTCFFCLQYSWIFIFGYAGSLLCFSSEEQQDHPWSSNGCNVQQCICSWMYQDHWDSFLDLAQLWILQIQWTISNSLLINPVPRPLNRVTYFLKYINEKRQNRLSIFILKVSSWRLTCYLHCLNRNILFFKIPI